LFVALVFILADSKTTSMSRQHFDEGSPRKYTLTVFLSFVAIFCFVMLMKLWQGDFMPGATNDENELTAAEVPHASTEVTDVSGPPKEESIKVVLPNGTELNAFKGGIEDKLVAYLNDSTSKAGKDVWFDFDNLNFKLNSAEITEDSYAQIQNIEAILKAYPKLKIKIGGYTDKTGDSAANMKLSQERAAAVFDALKKINGNPEQLTGAEGYGSQFAKASAEAPDEERMKDRRISLGIRAK